jgi:hypothetical protein
MLCPHCGFENPEARKYCRGCAKPLVSDAVPSDPAPPVPARPPMVPPPPAPFVSKMAIASLGLSLLAMIPPFGIASVVLGHVSRRQIATSQGRQKGTALAFAGLISSYLQLLIVGVLFVVLIGLGYEMNQKFDHDQYLRAALVERILNGDPNHPSAAVMAKNGENLIDALHLIQARQDAYQAEHSNYACHLIYLENLGTDDELIVHVRNSHYGVQVFCSGLNASRTAVLHYAVTAMPNTESNPPDAPSYCVDENKTIRRYRDTSELSAIVMFQGASCPEDGQPLE